MPDPKMRFALLAGAALLMVTLVACGGESHQTARHDDEEQAADVVPEEVSETLVAAKLAGADLVDGEADHVVSRCAGCALAMEGKAEHALQVEGYEMHFCSDSCQSNFEEDTLAKVAQLDIPEGD